jgi:hypothetical protein
MTTLRQVKRLLIPLIRRNGDLAPYGRWLILKPVRHVLRGILIERTGEASRFRPWWAVSHLCDPLDSFPLNWATMIHRGGLWQWENPTIQEELFEAIEQQALPTLRAIESLADFVEFASSKERFPLTAFDGYLLRKAGVDAALGNLDSARAICRELATGRTRWSMPLMREDFLRVTETLCPLLESGDRPAIARLLHEWEAYTIEKLKLQDIWEKTPFPLELESSAS